MGEKASLAFVLPNAVIHTCPAVDCREAAQADWMEATFTFRKVYGFVFILTYSRYLFLKSYPPSSMEFFLDGHSSAYEEIKDAARRNWYDNLRSAVIRIKPELTFNAQFLDYVVSSLMWCGS